MKQLIVFIKKEFYQIFRDRRTMTILLIMPIAQILLFGFAINTEVKNTRVAVYDPSKDASTQLVIDRFQASDYFTIAEELTNPDQINDVFKSGKIDLVMVFSENFAENLLNDGQAAVQLIADGTDPNQASILTGYASGILSSYRQELMEQYNVPFQITPEVKMLYNPQSKSAYNFVPGVMGLILMLICAMMTSIAIVREKETGTMEILLSSPLKPTYIILAKAVPFFVLSVVNLITILLLSVFVIGVPIAGSLFLLVLVSLLLILVALALGLLISTLVDTQLAAMMASGMGLMMPIMLLSGMMFPVESMPDVLQWLSSIVPARWFIEAVKKIMIQGVEIRFVAKELCILAAMAFGLIAFALSKFKNRLN
ncbi:MAG: ABC transporter permease [Tannerella sp.]|jgi:ABC-2 type transport system permease protein|nr:ABC transporter permease [Tannerella sp.]